MLQYIEEHHVEQITILQEHKSYFLTSPMTQEYEEWENSTELMDLRQNIKETISQK